MVEKAYSFKSEKDWDQFLAQNSEDLFNFESYQIGKADKEAVVHKKFFKRFCKLLVSNLIDMYPKRDKILPSIVSKICILSQVKQRLVRMAFTYISMQLTKVLLAQHHDLSKICQQLRSQPTLNIQNDDMTQKCLGMIEESLGHLSEDVIQ